MHLCFIVNQDVVLLQGDPDSVEQMNCDAELCAGDDLAGDNCYWACEYLSLAIH